MKKWEQEPGGVLLLSGDIDHKEATNRSIISYINTQTPEEWSTEAAILDHKSKYYVIHMFLCLLYKPDI